MLKISLRLVVTLFVGFEVWALAGFLAAEAPTQPEWAESIPEPGPSTDFLPEVDCTVVPPVGLGLLIDEVAEESGLDPLLLIATIHRESGCDQWALGSSGEVGLTQVNPSVWLKTLAREGIARRVQELWDPETNLRAAAYILTLQQEASKGDLTETFRRYNGSGKQARKYAREQVSYYQTLIARNP